MEVVSGDNSHAECGGATS